MRYNAYRAKPDRYNPQFIGIANRYGQLKFQRKISESNKQELESDFIYNQKEDTRLKKIIQAKAKELGRLKQAKSRHQKELEEKERRRKKEEEKLEALKQDNGSRREQARRNRQSAKKKLFQNNRSKKMTVDEQKQILAQACTTMTQSRLRYNKEMYETIKKDQEQGMMLVDAYHRHRNLTSLNDYKKRIHHELTLQKRHLKTAEKHEAGIKKLSESVNLKRVLLDDIQSEINKYRTNYRGVMRNSVWNGKDELSDSRLFLQNETLKI